MNNIEKLAINREAFESVIAPLLPNNNAMYDALAKYSTDEFNGQYMDGDVQKAWVKFQALQSSEPVAKYKASVGGFSPPKWVTHQEKHSGNLGEGYLPLFTHPPASVPLEKYNKLEQQLAELTDAYLLMRTGLNCLSDKAITGNQADILLGSEIPDFINYKERMRDIGSWEKLLTLAKGDWVKQAIAEAEGK